MAAALRRWDVVLPLWGIGLILATGCAARVSVESLHAEGYEKTYLSSSATGMRTTDYELWWKEIRGTERIAHFCIVPKVTGRRYAWTLHLLVEEKEVWSYSSKEFSNVVDGTLDPDCAVSRAIPEGRLSWRVSFYYK